MSESKLKALKVPELKEILNQAKVAFPARANKADLIAKILGSQPALDVYNQLHGVPSEQQEVQQPAEEPTPRAQVAEPEVYVALRTRRGPHSQSLRPEVSSTELLEEPEPAPEPTPAAKPAEAPAPAETQPTPAEPSEDEELAKRKARAARFNIPLVEPSKPKTPKTKDAAKVATTPATQPPVGEDPDKLAARAKRFGITEKAAPPAPATNGRGKKRSAPVDESPADPEEEERRKKRGERFGTSLLRSTPSQQNSVKA
ncbi:hypothetical protein EIP86_005619 [Pleurotus ostreatoroseus]|nr:hypothetical protein EIP86_005619 [Pleurotus ostreatoroseus]